MKKIDSQILEEILAELASCGEPIRLQGEKNNGILISEKDWSHIQEALFYLSIPGIIEGFESQVSLDESFKVFGRN